MKSYLTTVEVAKILKVNLITVRRWIKLGWLPAIRFGREFRVKEEDLEKHGKFESKREK